MNRVTKVLVLLAIVAVALAVVLTARKPAPAPGSFEDIIARNDEWLRDSARPSGQTLTQPLERLKKEFLESLKSSGPPSEQQQFENQLRSLRNQHSEAKKQRNRLNESAIEGQMHAWKDGLKASPVEVSGWLCTIKRVTSDRKLTCTSGIVTYHIDLAESQAKLLSSLGAGTQITVGGRATRESSITDGGALDQPEIVISDAAISR